MFRHLNHPRKGSPPRMRGKAKHYDIYAKVKRDHPRVCGEK